MAARTSSEPGSADAPGAIAVATVVVRRTLRHEVVLLRTGPGLRKSSDRPVLTAALCCLMLYLFELMAKTRGPLQGGVDHGLPAPFNGARSPGPSVNHFLGWLPHRCDGGAGQSER